MAKAGFNSKLKGPEAMNPEIYGDTNVPFDPLDEMKQLEEGGIVHPSVAEAAIQEFQGQASPQNTAPPADPNLPEENEEEGFAWSQDPEKKLQQVVERIAEFVPNPPMIEQLKQWKTHHGDIFLLHIPDSARIFIYRYVKRQEWKQMQAKQGWADSPEEVKQEAIFTKCLLWPALDPIALAGLPAGAVEMIVDQIMMQSLFLNPAQVAQITMKI